MVASDLSMGEHEGSDVGTGVSPSSPSMIYVQTMGIISQTTPISTVATIVNLLHFFFSSAVVVVKKKSLSILNMLFHV